MFSVRNQRGRIMVAICSIAIGVSALLAVSLSAGATTTGATPSSVPGVVVTPPTGVHPLTSSGCSGDACIYLTNPYSGELFVEVWAYDNNFYGHFQITGADTDADGNTDTQEWDSGGANNTTWAFESPSPNGQVCVTAWSSTGNDLGKACETNG
jgi:hypothetical protein